MYLAIDIGGTKTLLALFNKKGEITEEHRFRTNPQYAQFKKDLNANLDLMGLGKIKISTVVVGAPADIDYENQVLKITNNLGWRNIPLGKDLMTLFRCKIFVVNDAKLGCIGESELGAGRRYERVLYITLGTGIGTGFTINGHLEPYFMKSEGGHILCLYQDEIINWEKLASGKAFYKAHAQYARDVTNPKIWSDYARKLAVGFGTLNSIYRPDIIVVGGSMGAYLNKFQANLENVINKKRAIQTPLAPIIAAHDPTRAVVYGGYVVAKRGKL